MSAEGGLSGKTVTLTARKIRGAREPLLSLDFLRTMADCLRCAAHPQRLRIIEILLNNQHSVDDIATTCGLSQPATSGHLRLMENKGLLKSERRGREVYYSVAEPRLKGLIDCLREDHCT